MSTNRSADRTGRGRGKLGAVKTRNLLILAALAGTAIIIAFTIQLLTDGRFLG